MIFVQSVICKKSPLVRIQYLRMEWEFLILIINLITIMCLKLNWILTTEMGLAILLVAFQ